MSEQRTHRPAEFYQIYMRGWKVGAGSKVFDPMLAAHSTLGAEYNRGIADGREACGLASATAAKRLQHVPEILRHESKVAP